MAKRLLREKIIKETNDGAEKLEAGIDKNLSKIEKFLSKYDNDPSFKLHDIKLVVEKVDGIDHITTMIIYEGSQ